MTQSILLQALEATGKSVTGLSPDQMIASADGKIVVAYIEAGEEVFGLMSVVDVKAASKYGYLIQLDEIAFALIRLSAKFLATLQYFAVDRFDLEKWLQTIGGEEAAYALQIVAKLKS